MRFIISSIYLLTVLGNFVPMEDNSAYLKSILLSELEHMYIFYENRTIAYLYCIGPLRLKEKDWRHGCRKKCVCSINRFHRRRKKIKWLELYTLERNSVTNGTKKIQWSVANWVLKPKINGTLTETKEVGNLRLIKEVLFHIKHVIKWWIPCYGKFIN